jgi:hypothetical protein
MTQNDPDLQNGKKDYPTYCFRIKKIRQLNAGEKNL